MSIEEIILKLENLERRTHAKNAGLPDGWPLDRQVLADEATLKEAVAILKTHPDAQPNEPLTQEEILEMNGKPVWLDIENDGSVWIDEGNGVWGLVDVTVRAVFTADGGRVSIRRMAEERKAYRRRLGGQRGENKNA